MSKVPNFVIRNPYVDRTSINIVVYANPDFQEFLVPQLLALDSVMGILGYPFTDTCANRNMLILNIDMRYLGAVDEVWFQILEACERVEKEYIWYKWGAE